MALATPRGIPTLICPPVALEEGAGQTIMTMVTTFPSLEAMEQLAAMGMEEGIKAAIGQIDGILGLAA